jgi:hypothetical protein
MIEAGPGILTERGQAVESALLLLLEKLSPMERAAYLLREAFGYSYRQIARVVRVSEVNSRQLVTQPASTSPTNVACPLLQPSCDASPSRSSTQRQVRSRALPRDSRSLRCSFAHLVGPMPLPLEIEQTEQPLVL